MWRKIVCVPLLLVVLYQIYAYGNVIAYRALAPQNTAFMRLRMAQLSASKPNISLNYQWVDYNDISPNLKKAIIAAEDAHFAEHDGFDWRGIQSAIKRNEKNGKIQSGGSTISQQLAKNLFLNEQRSYWRKGEEAIITAMLEGTTSKDRIYELYLNVIEWGYGVYGAQAAAQHFYRQPASQLNKIQAASLAARVPAPLRYANNPKDPQLRNKTNLILRRMGSAELPENQ